MIDAAALFLVAQSTVASFSANWRHYRYCWKRELGAAEHNFLAVIVTPTVALCLCLDLDLEAYWQWTRKTLKWVGGRGLPLWEVGSSEANSETEKVAHCSVQPWGSPQSPLKQSTLSFDQSVVSVDYGYCKSPPSISTTNNPFWRSFILERSIHPFNRTLNPSIQHEFSPLSSHHQHPTSQPAISTTAPGPLHNQRFPIQFNSSAL